MQIKMTRKDDNAERLVTLCPAFGTNYESSDEQCQSCDVRDECATRYKQVSEEVKSNVQEPGKSPNGHRMSSAAGKIDECLYTCKDKLGRWPTVREVHEIVQLPMGRIREHLNYWIKRGRYV